MIDWTAVNGSLTNYTLRGDTTHFITGTTHFYSTTVIEGNAVLKATNGVQIEFNGPIDCRTAPANPMTITAWSDNTIGEVLPGSGGSPSGTYAYYALGCKDTATTYDLHDIRMFYVNYGFTFFSGVKANLSHVQVGRSDKAIAWLANAALTTRNFLIYDSTYAFLSNGAGTNRAEHGTMHRVDTFRTPTNSGLVTLTNSLLISCTNGLVYDGTNNVTSLDDSGFFQTIGSGAHYLIGGSTNRGTATTNVNPTLLAELKQRTTWPPAVLSNNITANTNFFAYAPRNGTSPDLGYAYAPLDYVAYGITISNATVTIAPGTAFGTYGASGTCGLQLLAGATLLSEGTPLNPCRFVRYNLVQEQANTNWSAASAGWSLCHSYDAAPSAQASFRFTEWSAPPAAVDHVQSGGTSAGTNWFRFRDCSFYNGGVYALSPKVVFTNCLFHRSPLLVYGLASETHNCTFVGGSWSVDGTVGSHNATDNLFDKTAFDPSYFGVTNDYNAYLSGYDRMIPTNGTHHVILTNLTYETGPLSRFYLPTNSPLINAGSTYATNVGLFHFTTVATQAKETNSTVDIGAHLVALNLTTVAPYDSDNDRVADYAEDKTGNGFFDSNGGSINPALGETDWLAPFTMITNFAGIKQQGEAEGDGVPDTMGAVGSNHFMVVVQTQKSVAVYDKFTGTRLSTTNTTLTNFFFVSVTNGPFQGAYPMFGAGDPRIVYDNLSQRWFATVFDILFGHVVLAVSNGPDPFGTGGESWVSNNWKKYLIPFGGECATDYPLLGVDGNGVYVFLRTDVGGPEECAQKKKIAALPLGPLVNGTASVVQTNYVFDFDGATPTIATFPVVNLDPVTTNDPAWFLSSTGAVIYYNKLTWVNGPAGKPQWETTNSWPEVTLTNIATYAEPGGLEAPQLGSTRKIRAGFVSPIMMAMTRKLKSVQYLWTCRQVGVNQFGNNDSPNLADRLAIEWLQIQTTPNIGNVGGGRIYDASETNPMFYYMPSLVINTNGDMLVGFSGSSMSNYVSTYYWGRLDNGTSLAMPTLYFAGKDWFDAATSESLRWGDYSYTTLDPNGSNFWTIQEYAETRYSPSGTRKAFGTRVLGITPY